MMNMAAHGLAANAQHRTDDALGIWTATGRGIRRVHENYDGWQIRTNANRTWTVHRPNGTPLNTAGRTAAWSTLWAAKLEAERAIRTEQVQSA